MGRSNLTNQRQKEITLAFYEVAKKVGLENASIAKVADKMGISKGLIMHYFATKESLIFALYEQILERYLNFVVAEKYLNIASKKELVVYISSLFSREWNLYIDDGVFYSFYALIYQNDQVSALYSEFLKTLRNGIATILQNCKDKNIIYNSDVVQSSNILYAMIDGAYFQLGAHINNKETYNKEAELFINHALGLLDFADFD
ncbi:MAG: AcrR family transcriptional regulator [Pseudohongiellaceae bacterium]|jgi:AcrR family transcriptional regulator